METGYATLPLAYPEGCKYLVGRFEAGSRVRLIIKDRPSAPESDISATRPLGYVYLDEFRSFLRERAPVRLHTRPLLPDESEGVLTCDGSTVEIEVDLPSGDAVSTFVLRQSFDQFAELIVGPVAIGCFFA